ncbi:hypothetical protein YC2023_052416 [Brassica napus]
MQPLRRSSRLTRNTNSAHLSTQVPETAVSSSRKISRKSSQRRIRCTPPPEDSEPEVESLSKENSSEEEEDMQQEILPKETRYENSRTAFQAAHVRFANGEAFIVSALGRLRIGPSQVRLDVVSFGLD